jgi:hypothetical protein
MTGKADRESRRPPPLFELRRARVDQGRAIAKRRRRPDESSPVRSAGVSVQKIHPSRAGTIEMIVSYCSMSPAREWKGDRSSLPARNAISKTDPALRAGLLSSGLRRSSKSGGGLREKSLAFRVRVERAVRPRDRRSPSYRIVTGARVRMLLAPYFSCATING